MSEERSLEGWVPELGEAITLAQVIDLAFDYRGNVTVIKSDGTEVAGYVFNRSADVPAPYVQMFDDAGNGPFTIPYADILNVRFTGKDMAAGRSWEAWMRRRAQEKAKKATGAGENPH